MLGAKPGAASIGNQVRLPRCRDYLIGSALTIETLTMRNYLHETAAIATLLALAVTLYTPLTGCQPVHQPSGEMLHAGR